MKGKIEGPIEDRQSRPKTVLSAESAIAPIIEAMESRYPERVIARTVLCTARPIIRQEVLDEVVEILKCHECFQIVRETKGSWASNLAVVKFLQKEMADD